MAAAGLALPLPFLCASAPAAAPPPAHLKAPCLPCLHSDRAWLKLLSLVPTLLIALALPWVRAKTSVSGSASAMAALHGGLGVTHMQSLVSDG